MTYADMSDFFYVWLRVALVKMYPEIFAGRFAPQTQEAISNPFRHPETEKREKNSLSAADEFYRQILTACWCESHRVLKDGGLLAFTFHHQGDDKWRLVLESRILQCSHITSSTRREDAKGIISRGKVNENTLLHYGPALSGKIAYAIIAFRTLASSGTTSLCSCPLCR